MTLSIDAFFEIFDELLPNESRTSTFVTELIIDSGKRCPHCNADSFVCAKPDRVQRCFRCQKLVYLTAGTFFGSSKLLRPLVCAVLITQAGISISDAELARRLKVAQSTAWGAMRKVGLVIAHTVGDVSLELSSAFKKMVSRRSRATPKFNHPIGEEFEPESGPEPACGIVDIRERLLEAYPCDAETLEQIVRTFDVLTGEVMSYDALCYTLNLPVGDIIGNVTILEIAGIAEEVHGRVRRKRAFTVYPGDDDALAGRFSIEEVMRKIAAVRGGVSRKYLQLHVSATMYGECAKIQTQNLLLQCLNYGSVTLETIADFVSQKQIAIPKKMVVQAKVLASSISC